MASTPIFPSLPPDDLLNASLTGMLVCQAVWLATGELADFTVLNANEAACTYWQTSPSRLIGQPVSPLFSERNSTRLLQQFSTVLASGQRSRFELTHPGLAGQTPQHYTLLVSKLADQLLVSFESRAAPQPTDYTDPAALLQLLMAYSPSLITAMEAVRDTNGQIVDFVYRLANDRALSMMGLSRGQVVGQRQSVLFPAVRQAGVFDKLVAVVEREERHQFEQYYAAVGYGAWLSTTYLRHQDGVYAISYDLTAMRQAETVLREAELAQRQQAELLERVMNTTPTAIVVHESIRNETGEIIDFRMTKVNQLAATLMQNTIDKVEHRRISQYFPGLLITPLFALYKEVVQTGEAAQLDVPWGEAWYSFSVAQFGDGIVASAQDITATRQHRQQIEQANSDLKRSNENLQAFAYVASHDLQEPLRKIVSFANILNVQYAGRFDPEITDIIRRITTATERMQMLIKDLLVYSQVDEKSAAHKRVSLNTVLDELQENELWAAIQQHKAIVTLGTLPTLLADAGQMRQLFQNLLSNAIKFSRPGVPPQVQVATRLVSLADVPGIGNVPGKPVAGQFHEISVTDNGIGFDEKYLDRIFQMFQRLHGRTKFPGSGIGLAICQKIVEKHGGTIMATSQPGKGSTFRIYLPVSM